MGFEIICGDALAEMPRLIERGVRVDAVVTDPPYGIGFAAQPTKWQRRAGHKPVAWDDATLPDIVSGLSNTARKVVIWGGNYYPLPPSRCWLSWCKPDAPPSMGDVEFAWTNLDHNSRHIIHSISATNPERIGHPTQKPLRVTRWSLEQCELPAGSLVLDPFCGSGTTGVAAVLMGYNFIGIDIDPHYCAVAEARMKRASGEACDIPRLVRSEKVLPLFATA